MVNPLDGDRYGDVICGGGGRGGLWWLGELAKEMGVLADCSIPDIFQWQLG